MIWEFIHLPVDGTYDEAAIDAAPRLFIEANTFTEATNAAFAGGKHSPDEWELFTIDGRFC